VAPISCKILYGKLIPNSKKRKTPIIAELGPWWYNCGGGWMNKTDDQILPKYKEEEVTHTELDDEGTNMNMSSDQPVAKGK
jgi:hypothetical protein